MELFPAIDLRAGRCVRLDQGDFGRETIYGDDPVAVARAFAAAGAPWIHVVDLDAARTGEPINRAVVAAIAGAVTAPVQTGGGVRSVGDVEALFAAGVTRVVLGTAAVERPQLVEELASRWPGRIAVGVDHRDGEVRLRGWLEGAGQRAVDVVADAVAAGAVAVIVTDISRDGRLSGPDVVGLAGLLELTGAPLIASGGVATLDDLRVLAAVRARPSQAAQREPAREALEGVIVGKALYEGKFTLAEALAACAAMGTP